MTVDNIKAELKEGLEHGEQAIQETLDSLIQAPVEAYTEIAGILVKLVVARDLLKGMVQNIEEGTGKDEE